MTEASEKVTEKWPKESRKRKKVIELLLPTSFCGTLKVASDLRFWVAISEPQTPSFCGISGDLAPSTRKSPAIAILRFGCAKHRLQFKTLTLISAWWLAHLGSHLRVSVLRCGSSGRSSHTPYQRSETGRRSARPLLRLQLLLSRSVSSENKHSAKTKRGRREGDGKKHATT